MAINQLKNYEMHLWDFFIYRSVFGSLWETSEDRESETMGKVLLLCVNTQVANIVIYENASIALRCMRVFKTNLLV